VREAVAHRGLRVAAQEFFLVRTSGRGTANSCSAFKTQHSGLKYGVVVPRTQLTEHGRSV
jgi:hypothetical protein